MLRIFISGLEKQSGKSLVTAGLAATMQSLSYSTGVFKPIITGCETHKDAFLSSDFSLIKKFDSNIDLKPLYVLSNSVSPFVGAYEDSVKIEINDIYSTYHLFADSLDCSIVEGCNSISSPIAQNLCEIDIAKTLSLPLVLVVNPFKSSVEDFLMANVYIKASKIPFLGVIVNQCDENSDNLEIKYYPQIIKELTGVKILGCIPNYNDFTILVPEVLIENILNGVKLEEVFGLKIAKLD